MSLSDAKVGDTLIRTGFSKGEKEVEVVRVGRTLIEVEHPGHFLKETFRIDTGRKNDAYGDTRVWTIEEYAEVRHEARLKRLLMDRGITTERILPVRTMEKLVRVLDEEES